MDAFAQRLLRTWALNAVAHAEALAATDPGLGSCSHPIAGGWLVLSGRGMYVNRAMGAGLEVALSAADLDQVVMLSRASGVVAAVEVTLASHPDTSTLLQASGFERDVDRDVLALARPISARSINAPSDVFVRPVTTCADLELWQETSSSGWGHTSAEALRTSDAYAVAANSIDDEYLVLAFDAADARPLGCASTTLRGGVATLGGMSTLPAERRRGVQAALLRYRFDFAASHGCDLVATTASVGGPSERNLRRHGFIDQFAIETHTLPSIS